jgi:adenosine deaminase
MPRLLLSLGTTWAVVPEAFHALPPGPHGFSAVHVLTTDSPTTAQPVAEVIAWFRARHPSVLLSITRVAGFADLRSEADHFRFEEVMYRWILEVGGAPLSRHICLAGGFETMSAAMQKAAAVLGAAEVFHVLADPLYPTERPGQLREARTAEEIDDSLARHAVRHLRLGPESGWPQLRTATAADYPLATAVATPVASSPAVRTVQAPDFRFRDRLRDIVTRSHQIAENWSSLSALPFAELAAASAADLAWLHEPLAPTTPTDRAWLAALAKIELHCHLGGFATHGDDLAAIRAAAAHPAALPPLRDCTPPPAWPEPATPCGLETYRHLGDNNGSALLRDPGCLRAQCQRLYTHLVEQHVVYAEIRCSPANYADPTAHRSPFTVLTEIRAAFQRCMDESRSAPAQPPRCHVNLIIIGTRQTSGDFRTAIGRHLMLAVTAAEHWRTDDTCRVVGVDLAGFEDATTRAHYFRDDFKPVHRCGLALTVHAGENDDAEGIWSAVLELNARRLGHALSLRESDDLLRAVADRGIALEMCPYANLQIKGYPLDAATTANPTTRYPLLGYLRAGLRVTVNTDNIGISAASLTDNLLLAARLCPGLTRLDVLRLQRHALDAAFVSPADRTALLGRFATALTRH